ncbi:MAG: AmmeMemoRadiSam system protein B [Candidatus Melainabacteria bacterium]|nr:AmmeMemoRadiSam system protein B [Candidatus Melainabacteria bacterium]
MNIFGRKEKNKTGKRATRFAGTWYESDPKKLGTELKQYLEAAGKSIAEQESHADNSVGKTLAENRNRAVYAIVAPHAGYMFSGSTAGFAYEFAKRCKPKRVFLLGPSHYAGFEGVALSPDTVFETPLGALPVDRKVVDQLAQHPMFKESREIHQREHSLEMQLSFIREAFGEVQIVPLIIGLLPESSDVQMVGQIIRQYVHEDDLVVVSSDFTHYGPRYDYVPFESDVAEARVKELDLEAFECLNKADVDGFMNFHDRTKCTICGFYPCAVLLSMLPENTTAQLLRYQTSRDTSLEDKFNSVSYLAIGFTGAEGTTSWEQDLTLNSSVSLTDNEKHDLLKLARQALELYVKEGKILKPANAGIEITPTLKRPLGVFVTLFTKKNFATNDVNSKFAKKENKHNRDLRGCIGYIWPIKSLAEAVVDNAIGACSKDPRFDAVEEPELSNIEIEISVLTPLTRVASEREIEIGKHGVVLHLKGRQSVFLPHVATEYGWTVDDTLTQLAIKAGLGPNEWRNGGAKYDVFESIMFEEEH